MRYLDIQKRHDFVILFDVRDGNPNGDPDAGNLPRIDPETMHGLVTDVCLKRKIRDYVMVTKRQEPGYDIFIRSETFLNALIEQAAVETSPELRDKLQRYDALSDQEKRELSRRPQDEATRALCRKYYDIRLFGAVLSTGRINAGQVRGPVQLTFARSIDPIQPLAWAITRKARTTEERLGGGETEMGRKPNIPYGLYRAHGFFNATLASQTGVSEDDLRLFWDALENMFELDRSALRGEMSMRGIYVFTHESPYGDAHAHSLFELVQVRKRDGVDVPRSFHDYIVEVPPEGDLADFGFPRVHLAHLYPKADRR